MSPSTRTETILSRFPRHFEADAPGKLFAEVVDGLDLELDVKSVQLGKSRRSHAIDDVDEDLDLLRLSGLHDLGPEALEILRLRVAALQSGGAPLRYAAQLDLMRGTVHRVIALHRAGNGTVSALLGAAATYLGLPLESIRDTSDRYWHVATCGDVLPAAPPAAGPGPAAPDLIALEDNPLREQDSQPVGRRHGDRFTILRRGFETVLATVRVVGVDDRTVAPMVVNLDTCTGVVFTGTVPDGQELRFEGDGRVTLGGAGVARLSYSFSGGLFADAAQAYPRDSVFAGSAPTAADATFAVTAPVPDAFDPATVYPHTDGLLSATPLPVGESRWAVFVRSAAFGRSAATPADELAVPVFSAAVWDGSVFEPDTSVGAPASAKVGFSWQEHEPYAARVWIPMRLAALDEAGEMPVNERLRLLLDRHRPGAIHVYVEYADDHWTLPGGVMRDANSGEPLGTIITGTALWRAEAGSPQ